MVEFTSDTEHPITIACNDAQLDGLLHIPSEAKGIVIFVHGSGSSRFSVRNQQVAKVLQQAKIATLLFDLLTPEEDEIDNVTTQFRFDIKFLADRLVSVTNWILKNPVLRELSLGYFGASTGGGAALVAAARLTNNIKAVVSRGGRPDLAGESLQYVEAPTLLIVGSLDSIVIDLNELALEQMHCIKQLDIVEGATHLFEEAGKLEEVANLAKNWFSKHF